MVDLRIASVRRILTIIRVAYVERPVPALSVEGVQLHYATQFLINDRPAEFFILSPQQALVQIPTSIVGKPVTRVLALTDVPALNQPNDVSFGIGASFRFVTGWDATIQLFMKIALTSPGTNRFRLSSGGGLQDVLSFDINEDNKKAIQAAAVESIVRAREEVVALQNQNRRLTNDERLASAEVTSIGVNTDSTSIPIVTVLQSVSGRRAAAGMEI